ncbi:MAG: hypothetical protein WCN92_11130 [Eubacteriales bacterium]
MEKFTPYAKLPKRKKREIDIRKRGTWGRLNPVTRKPPNPKVYSRKKTQERNQEEDFNSAPFVL